MPIRASWGSSLAPELNTEHPQKAAIDAAQGELHEDLQRRDQKGDRRPGARLVEIPVSPVGSNKSCVSALTALNVASSSFRLVFSSGWLMKYISRMYSLGGRRSSGRLGTYEGHRAWLEALVAGIDRE